MTLSLFSFSFFLSPQASQDGISNCPCWRRASSGGWNDASQDLGEITQGHPPVSSSDPTPLRWCSTILHLSSLFHYGIDWAGSWRSWKWESVERGVGKDDSGIGRGCKHCCWCLDQDWGESCGLCVALELDRRLTRLFFSFYTSAY